MSGCGNSNLKQSFLVVPSMVQDTLSACTAIYTNELISCSGDSIVFLSSGETIFNTSITPLTDGTIDVGVPSRRFRDINTISGTSTVWTSTISVTTPTLNLGLDSLSNNRIINADNSIIQDDTLNGGTF
jgi:hypothetical protein